jgi:Fe-S oxidoreductase
MPELAEIARKSRAWACYDCGKCTATCPIVRAGADYSPRHHVLSTNLGHEATFSENGRLRECLTCMQCDARCPVGVEYTRLVRDLREYSYRDGGDVECPHGGALQSAMRIMAKGGMKQDRLAWLEDDLETSPGTGEVLYWTGCTMYYDSFFSEFELSTLNGTRSAIRVMNKLGIKPVVSPDERCCGHDLLWNGDRASFEQLARHNARLIRNSGAETVVVSCAECLRTLKQDYGDYMDGAPRFMHITEFLLEHAENLKFGSEDGDPQTVTYQDPCRLGRHLGVYDAPRELLERLPGVRLAEMPRSGRKAICCAGGTWSNCDRYAKKLQVERLRESKATGANTLLTACPKCQVHFRCAMVDPNLSEEITIAMRDIAELIDEAMA